MYCQYNGAHTLVLFIINTFGHLTLLVLFVLHHQRQKSPNTTACQSKSDRVNIQHCSFSTGVFRIIKSAVSVKKKNTGPYTDTDLVPVLAVHDVGEGDLSLEHLAAVH